MDWLSLRPEQIVDRAEPQDLLPRLKERKALSREESRMLDFVLRQWTISRLSRRADVEGLLELDDLAALAARALGDEQDAPQHRIRWQAFRDLLESKRLAVLSRDSGRARNLAHADKILELLGRGELPQSKLRERLGLSAARLSQVLGVMEEGGLVERRRSGRESLVSIPGASPTSVGEVVWAPGAASERDAA